MFKKSPEIPKQELEQSSKEEKPLELTEEDESRAKSIEALKKMKELVEGKEEEELPPERRLSPGEKRKIDDIIEEIFKVPYTDLDLEGRIESFGEKIVEPFLNKLESLDDSQLKDKDHKTYLLILYCRGKVKEIDAERLANLLLRDPITYHGDSSRKKLLVQMLGRVGNEKTIDKLVEYSQKVVKSPYKKGLRGVSSVEESRIDDQKEIKDALMSISERNTKEEKDIRKRIEVKKKIVEALDIIKDNISNL